MANLFAHIPAPSAAAAVQKDIFFLSLIALSIAMTAFMVVGAYLICLYNKDIDTFQVSTTISLRFHLL